MYGWQDDGDVGYWLLKRDDANDRCMLIHVEPNCTSRYGVKSSDCYDIGKVILSNSAADCQYNIDFSPVPKGQTVEASCGGGTADFCDVEGYLAFNHIKLHFEFPPTYPWVPASDTYCLNNCVYANQTCSDPAGPFISGC